MKRTTFKKVESSTASATYVEVLNITGKGEIYEINGVANLSTGSLKITIDGVVQEFVNGITTTQKFWSTPSLLDATNKSAVCVSFSTSLKIEICHVTGNGTVTYGIYYGEEA